MPGLLLLSLAAFVTLSTEILPAGLLQLMSPSLGVSDAQVGLLVSVFAVASAICAIPVVALTRLLPRRPLLVCAISVVVVANIVTAASSVFTISVVARILAGAASGLTWALVTGYASRMVPEPNRGRALAIVLGGSTIALALGVPAGTALAHAIGWRPTFLIIAVLGLVIAALAPFLLPSLPGTTTRERMPIRDLVTHIGVRGILSATVLFLLGHGLLYTYIAPFQAYAGLGSNPSLLLFVFGLAAIAGIWLTGIYIDAYLRRLLILGLIILILAMTALGTIPFLLTVALAAVAAWGLVFGSAPTIFQTALMNVVPPHEADLASSILITVYNGGIAVGSFLGAILIQTTNPATLPWTSLIAFATTLAIVVTTRHSFPQHPRGTT